MIPLMVGMFGVRQHKAHGTSLVALVFTGISGAVVYFRKDSADISASLLLAATAVFTAKAGARYAHALPESKLKRSFGGFLVLVSFLLLMKPYLVHQSHSVTVVTRASVLLITGVFSGFLSGLMGVGGGCYHGPGHGSACRFRPAYCTGSFPSCNGAGRICRSNDTLEAGQCREGHARCAHTRDSYWRLFRRVGCTCFQRGDTQGCFCRRSSPYRR